MTDAPPPAVRLLIEQRAAARADRDWETADRLRAELADLGWEPQDRPDGSSSARPILNRAGDVPTEHLDEPAAVAASVQIVAEGQPADLERFVRALATHAPPIGYELVVVENGPAPELEPLLASVSLATDPVIVPSHERLGWADARTLGMRASRGEVTILADTLIEPTGDFVSPLVAAFDDPRVGVAGGWGVRSGDGRAFVEAPPGEVDAVEGYCLAIRREALRAVGGFDRRFRWYRHADLDLSFAVRDAGWTAVRTEPLPLARHEHRGWSEMAPAERDRLSKRNFYRFLDHWGDRRDLLLSPEADG